MTTRGRLPTQFPLTALLMMVLLAAPVSSSAAVPVTHFQANGTFADVFFTCNASVCGALSVFLGGSSGTPKTFVSYALFLPDGSYFFGQGTIPNANVTKSASNSLTLAPTDTSIIDGFTNTFCDVNGNCTDAPENGGIVSGTWKAIKFVSSRFTFSNVTHFGQQVGSAQLIMTGTSDTFPANAQLNVKGNSFFDIGDIGTQHNTQITIQH